MGKKCRKLVSLHSRQKTSSHICKCARQSPNKVVQNIHNSSRMEKIADKQKISMNIIKGSFKMRVRPLMARSNYILKASEASSIEIGDLLFDLSKAW